jgi:two-component system chemotaxis response regulator CheB
VENEGDELRPGWVYIAPPDNHLLVNGDGTLSLSHSELVHFVRPSTDLLFESMAASYGERAIAVVLTGSGSGGEMGVQAVKEKGGTVTAQSEGTAEYFGMPGTAIATRSVEFVLDLDEIAPALVTLVMGDRVVLDAINRRGQAIKCYVTRTIRRDVDGEPEGVVLLMEEERR